MYKHVKKQVIGGKRYKDLVTVEASTKKEEKILKTYKYDCIDDHNGCYNDIDTDLLPKDDAINGYLWPENYTAYGFDYDLSGLRIPSNLDVINAVYTVKNPIRAAKWRRRHGFIVKDEVYGDSMWGFNIYHIIQVK